MACTLYYHRCAGSDLKPMGHTDRPETKHLKDLFDKASGGHNVLTLYNDGKSTHLSLVQTVQYEATLKSIFQQGDGEALERYISRILDYSAQRRKDDTIYMLVSDDKELEAILKHAAAGCGIEKVIRR